MHRSKVTDGSRIIPEKQGTHWLSKFRRVTSSGRFIPEIDGLRFIALAAVVLFHINAYLGSQQANYRVAPQGFNAATAIFEHGAVGVQLFFSISGFILALPFATQFLRGGTPIKLRHYYLRRLTRLEPPYILSLILFFLLIARRHYNSEYLHSFLASLFYSHNFFWPRGTLPLINPVAWSLEVEVQFYLLAPLIAYCYLLPTYPRRILLILLILSKYAVPTLPHLSLLDFYDTFLVGFLLADLYVSGELAPAKPDLPYFLGALASFYLVWEFNPHFSTLAIGLFYFFSLKSKMVRGLLSREWVTAIGGMCYSIYLIHWMLITTIGSRVTSKLTQNYALDYMIHAVLLLAIILVTGAIYFKLIERPCMARDWPKKLIGAFL